MNLRGGKWSTEAGISTKEGRGTVINGSDNQLSLPSWFITILRASSTARHTEHSFARNFNESRSKNTQRMKIYFNIC
jgi:hypothetical protein